MRKNFRRLRQNGGVSQVEVARRSGINRAEISMFECGHLNLSKEKIQRLEQAVLQSIQDRTQKLNGILANTAQ